jgi:transcriptional regulator PpsR
VGLSVEALRGSSFAQHFVDRSNVELTESLMNATLAEEEGRVTMVAARTQARVIAHPVVFRAGGQRVMMVRLVTEAKETAAPDTAADHALALFRSGSDAMLFMTPKGLIVSVNESFLDLVGAAHTSDVVGRSLGDFLGRGQIDLSVLTEQPQRSGHMRIYATRLVNELGTKLAVEISATHLVDSDVPVIGCVIRDVSRAEAGRTAAGASTGIAQMPAEPARNVMDLVGSASLKDIVAETTDVVERMCIETAVELTNNNRVAAAEMLGLSRQSLYVKLRKFGLLNKNS